MQNNLPPLPSGRDNLPSDRTPDSLESAMQAKTRMERNIDRQRRLVNDTQRLWTLANQLKTEVASSRAEAATPEMLHQMDEIEKLARSVKDKMRD